MYRHLFVVASINIATLNAQCLFNNPPERAIQIAAEAVRAKLDALALQEVCETPGTAGTKANDNFAETVAREITTLAKEPWIARYRRTHRAWNKYDEGLAILAPAKWLTNWGSRELPQGSGPFPRVVVWGRLSVPVPIFFYNVHLTTSHAWTDRVDQVKATLALVREHQEPNITQVVLGDFNDKHWTGPLQAIKEGPPSFIDAWDTLHPGDFGFTFPYPNLADRIDYIFVNPAKNIYITEVERAFPGVSDHMGLRATLTPENH
jgi:endonuclease/exonuclease/phosphatase family metal-dependent hydrolase